MPTELPDPARERLVDCAAAVLGSMPHEEIPTALRKIAKFAPAKRARLGAVHLAAALDADEVFRDRVAESVETATPQLFESVREGVELVAVDPMDAIVALYLVRPDGWLARIEELSRDRSATVGADEVGRLSARIAELEQLVRAQAAEIEARLAAETAQLRAQVSALSNDMRSRTRELRAAERDRDRARAEADSAVVDAEARAAATVRAAAASNEAEVKRLRARLAELERAATGERRTAKLERDVDAARLWLLVDTLTEAAAGLRRELALPARAVRPADTVAAAEPGAATRRIADPAGLDQALALPSVHLIVDGYNVTKSGFGEMSLADQRSRLVTGLAGLAGRTGAEITVAFDGANRPVVAAPAPRGVRVLFSREGQIADDLIRDLVAAEPEGRAVVVVTSDQAVVLDVLRAGAWAAPSAALLARLAGTRG